MKRVLVVTAVAAFVMGLLVLPATALYLDDFTVTKEVTGDSPDDDVTWDFELSCTFDGGRDVTFDSEGTTLLEFTLGDEAAREIENVPPDATCTITETGATDGAVPDDDFTTSFILNDGAPIVGSTATFTVDQTPFTVAFVNDFGEEGVLDAPSILVEKAVTGLDSGDAYLFEAECTEGLDPFLFSLSSTDSLEFPVTAGPEDAPVDCTITEIDDGGADTTVFEVNGEQVTDGSSVTVTLEEQAFLESGEDAVVAIRAENTFEDPEDAVADQDADVTAVLAVTGFEISWAMLLGFALVLVGAGIVLYTRRRERRGVA